MRAYMPSQQPLRPPMGNLTESASASAAGDQNLVQKQWTDQSQVPHKMQALDSQRKLE